MVENQYETNCECTEISNSKKDNNKSDYYCETHSCKTNSENSPCCGGDPIAEAKSLLEKSFFIALKEVHVEKLKKRIEAEWGSTIDKAVDLTIKTAAKQWQGSLSQASASKEFYSELEKIFNSTKK
ncbi:MAG TPA: hypothetical protein VFM31_05385 [Nitrososphaeraceae archaeon]|nr:hypothetical protein [Nitrososphaeraceae archaeon]